MRYLMTLAFLFLLSSASFSQNVDSRANAELMQDQNNLSNQVITLTLDLTGISKNVQGQLKDEFLTYNGKIISLELNEDSEVLVLKHNGHFKQTEVFEILEKYNISQPSVTSHK